MWPLIKKDLRISVSTPIAAALFALFLFITGFAFSAHVTRPSPYHLPEASMRGMIYFIAVILLFLAPLLTMRSFAEERRSGTLELLKTAPLSDLQIVLAKFLSHFLLLALLLLLTVEYPVFLFLSGEPDIGPLALSYLGLLLIGSAFIACGLFCSALTRNQLIAALFCFILLLTLWFLDEVGGEVGASLSILKHLEAFSQGVLDLADFSYYLLFTFLFLFLTVRYLEAERWR